MVVGGVSEHKAVTNVDYEYIYDDSGERYTERGMINDVEVLQLSQVPNIDCSTYVRYVGSDTFQGRYRITELANGRIVYAAETEVTGLTGIFTKDAAIICGGHNAFNAIFNCFEWDAETNK